MNKYVNIFHSSNSKECYIVNEENTELTEKIEVGHVLSVLLGEETDPVEVTLQFDAENSDFYLDNDGEPIYDIQGLVVV